MSDLDAEELAQLGLKQIEDAIVGLLSRHDHGLNETAISSRLGLDGSGGAKRSAIVAAVLAFLVEADRIRWDDGAKLYRDNPDKI